MSIIERVTSYKEIFESEKSKVVLADLLQFCGMFRQTFNGDVNEMLINEGKRNVLLYILSQTNIDLPQLLKMMEDNRKERMNGDGLT